MSTKNNWIWHGIAILTQTSKNHRSSELELRSGHDQRFGHRFPGTKEVAAGVSQVVPTYGAVELCAFVTQFHDCRLFS